MITAVYDCDDVLARCSLSMSTIIEEMSGVPVDVNDWHDFYDFIHQYEVDIKDVLDAMVEQQTCLQMLPYEDAALLTNKSKNDWNMKNVIVTARGYDPNALDNTWYWCKKHGIEVDHIHILGYREKKSDVIAKLGAVSFYVEDNPHHTKDVMMLPNVERVFLRDQPWNRKVCTDGMGRAHSLTEIIHVMNIAHTLRHSY